MDEEPSTINSLSWYGGPSGQQSLFVGKNNITFVCGKLLLNMITSACEGDPSGSGVLVGARICSTARVLHWPGSR